MANTSFDFNIGALTASLTTLQNVGSVDEDQMAAACQHLERAIKQRAPVDTGNLKSSYRYVVTRDGGTVVGHVGTNVEYARHQELGARYQAGTPHVRPAVEAEKQRLGELLLADSLDDVI